MKKRQKLLTEEPWELIGPLLPEPKRCKDARSRPPAPNRGCLERILWVLQAGAAWRFLPDEYPSPSTRERVRSADVARLGGRAKPPSGANVVTGIAIRVALEIILVLRLGLPKRTGWLDLCYSSARPESGRLNVINGLESDPPLLIARVENRRAIACSYVIPLAILCSGVMDLEKKLQNFSVTDLLRVENDLHGLGMCSVVAISRIVDIAARVSNSCCNDARLPPKQILHPPEASAGQDRTFRGRRHSGKTPNAGWLPIR